MQGSVARFGRGTDHDAILGRHAAIYLAPVLPPSEMGNVGELGGLPGRVGQLLALLGVAALLNAAVLTLRQGRRQLAVHRALGFTRAQVVVAHLWQGVITAIAGASAGASAGFVVGRAIHRQLLGDVGAIAETILPAAVWAVVIGAVGACLGAALVTGALAVRNRPGAVLRAE